MDIAAAIGIGRKVAKVAKKAKELYELDQKRRVRVNADVVLGRFRDDITFSDGSVRSVPDFRCDDFAIADGVFTVFETGDRAPFCDGSSLAPDRIGSWNTIKAALGHDAGYEHMEEMAAAWGWSVEDVRWLIDAMFGDLLKAEARRQRSAVMRAAGGVLSRIYHAAVRAFGGIYHRAKQVAPLLAFVVVAGCVIPDVFEPSDEQPDYEVRSSSTSEAAERAGNPMSAPVIAGNATGVAVADEVGTSSAANGGQMEHGADAVDFADLDWCWGGFDGKKAARVDGCEIKSLKVTASGLSFKWARGGCEQLGAASASDYSRTLACLFCRIGGKWQGGKFDWISTSRTTRDFANVRDGYNGWRKDAIETAEAYAFCIVSKDGKKRTNVIISGR